MQLLVMGSQHFIEGAASEFARLISLLFDRYDFRFSIFGEKVIECLGHEEL